MDLKKSQDILFEIREIGALETYAVRHPVLRDGKPIDSCHFEGDALDSTKHFGYFEDGYLTGVVSVFESGNSCFSEDHQFQIRGMAVLHNQQNKGIGIKLIRHIEAYLGKYANSFLWFNARENAVGFYKKLGYIVLGDAFEIADVGTHYIMYKNGVGKHNSI